MLHQTICEDLPSAISLPELASGHILCVWPDGRITSRSGQEVARASLSARQVRALDLLTSGTYGQPSTTLSASADLSTSLANRLQLVTQMNGSTLYKQTWKEWVTPSGLRRLRQRASVRRTSESELTGWPTPVANTNPQPETKRGLQHVSGAARLTGWPTPAANEFEPRDLQALIARRERCKKVHGNGNGFGLTLGQAAPLFAAWVTPTSRDWKDTSGMVAQRDGKERLDQLPRQAYTAGPLRLTVFGEMRTGSYVEMANGVQLNPAHSRWLQGLPKAWDIASPHYEQWQAATAQADLRVMATL